jgi:hypothetical protein
VPTILDLHRLHVGARRSDTVLCAQAAHRAVDYAHVEVLSPGRIAVEPFAFYDEPLPVEALADVDALLREHAPEWLLVEVRFAWRYIRAG